MYRSLSIFVLCSAIWTCPGQITFERTFGSPSGVETGNSICLTDEGDYVITGMCWGYYLDVLLMKISRTGDSLWSRSFSVDFDDIGYSVIQCRDGGFAIAGLCNKNDWDFFSDIYLLRTDELGNEVWSKIIGGNLDEGAKDILQTDDDGFIMVGFIGTGGVDGDMFLVRTDANGDTLWTRRIGGDNIDVGNSIQQTSDGGFVMAGATYSFGSGYSDVYLVKTDQQGTVIWSKAYGGMDYDWGYSVKQTDDNGYIIVGFTQSFGDGSQDIYLVRTDSSGDTIWTKVIAHPYSNVGRSIVQTTNGHFVLTGYTAQNEKWEAILININSNGRLHWERLFPGEHTYSYGYDLQMTQDSGYIICGSSDTGSGSDLYLIKTDEEGMLDIKEDIFSTQFTPSPCPNPSHGVIMLELMERDEEIKIYTLEGQCIYREMVHPATDYTKKKLDLSSFPSGIYLIEIVNPVHRRSGKVVIL